MIGIVLGAAYMLWLYQRVMFGPVTNPANEHLADLNTREYATLVPLVILASGSAFIRSRYSACSNGRCSRSSPR